MARRVPMFHAPRRAGRRRRLSWAAMGCAPVLVLGGTLLGHEIGDRHDSGVRLAANSEITLIGHGLGHGRGMGQWGAFGYAKQGWSSAQILSHFYGGTTAGKVDNPPVTVVLTERDVVNVHADAGMRVGNQVVAPGQAVRLSGSTATITAGCGGAVVSTVTAPNGLVSPVNAGANRPANEWLKFCGNNDAFRGLLGYNPSGDVINVLSVDDYVKGVTPREALPVWGDQGGTEALKAQAVAARSYVLAAMNRGKVIDDTQNSQVYGGASGEDPRTNAAADATAGQVLNGTDGKPAFTEFSSSTGGYSAGVGFPAAVDDGDALSPNHNWTAQVSAASIGSAFGVGQLTDIAVTKANGLGAEFGRALEVRVTGTGGTVTVTGDQARTKLQLKSAWFSIAGQPKPQIVAPSAGVSSGSGPAATLPGDISIPGLGSLGSVSDLVNAATTAIAAKVAELGGTNGALGQALGPVLALPGLPGAVQAFQNGNVYFSQDTGAHALIGQALQAFLAQGAQLVKGFPAADQLN